MDKPIKIATFPKSQREEIQLSLQVFAGRKRVDLRVAAELSSSSGAKWPTKKGVALDIEHLPALRAALADAEVKALELGWIGEGSGK